MLKEKEVWVCEGCVKEVGRDGFHNCPEKPTKGSSVNIKKITNGFKIEVGEDIKEHLIVSEKEFELILAYGEVVLKNNK